ncbi:hypothetical protein Pse7367_3088 [Thalassoporum mexicanum PCC 7367]|uniref:hypothetical protein n=1 Tax=Thalassoporum mexicanum TaxID=3457544 RepID=UPI00029FD8AE|nr:hypothetical protein [Pseudanabaena sp. PCC 7367]AFY71337.1 hypothetical protein Pse7367_3088 [Pseudanabaena sp. PCC 7367]
MTATSPVSSSKNTVTKEFLSIWPYVAAAALVLIVLAGIVAPFFQQKLLSQDLRVTEGVPVSSQPFELKPTAIGALRIDAVAKIPTNRWVTYELQVLDPSNQVITSAIKNAWSESGTWREGGESGTWSESDLKAGLDVQARKQEQIKVAIEVLEYTNTAGNEINEAVPIKLTVNNGAIDGRYLWTGFFGVGAMALITFVSVPNAGKLIINKRMLDSDVGDRAVMGGPDKLLRVNIHVKADETCPSSLRAYIYLKDSYGEQLYASQGTTINMARSKDDDGSIESGSGRLTQFFTISKRGSYGFYVEIMPDASVDSTRLEIKEGASTTGAVQVTQILV